MNDELYRKLLKMKALERWENEGGRVSDDQDSKASYRRAKLVGEAATRPIRTTTLKCFGG